MQEKLKRVLSQIGKNTKEFLKNPFGIPPSFEELSANFPHKQGCSQKLPLRQVESTETVNIPDSLSMGEINPGYYGKITLTYLQCVECGVEKQFRKEE